jgi:hypothetical protein
MRRLLAASLVILFVLPASAAKPKKKKQLTAWPTQAERGETVVLRAPTEATDVDWAVLPNDTKLWLFEGDTVLVLETLGAPEKLIIAMATSNDEINVLLHEIQVGDGGPAPDPQPNPNPPPPEPDPEPGERWIIFLDEGTILDDPEYAVVLASQKWRAWMRDRSHLFLILDPQDRVPTKYQRFLDAPREGKSLPLMVIGTDKQILGVESLPDSEEGVIDLVKQYGG